MSASFSTLTFHADGASKEDAAQNVSEKLDAADIEHRVDGVGHLIDHLKGEYSVIVTAIHKDEEDLQGLLGRLVKADLVPDGQINTGILHPEGEATPHDHDNGLDKPVNADFTEPQAEAPDVRPEKELDEPEAALESEATEPDSEPEPEPEPEDLAVSPAPETAAEPEPEVPADEQKADSAE